MSHKDNFIKKNTELNKPIDIFNVGFVGAAGGSIPDQVTGVSVTPDSSTELTVTWNAVDATPAVSGYLVERSPNGSSSWTTVASSNSTTSFADSGLSVYTYYYYRVSAINSIGTGVASSVANDRTLGTVPNQVTGLSASATSTSNINLSWSAPSANPAISNYTVERSTNNSSWTSLGTTTSTSMSSGGLSTYTLYYYRVKANNSVGSGSYSSSSNARTNGTAPNQVTGLSASVSGNNINISWSSVGGGNPASYTYYIDKKTTGGWSSLTSTGSTSTTHSSPTKGVAWYYRVRASNSVGYGSWSSNSNGATVPNPVLTSSGATVSSSGGYTYRKFTSSGSVTVTGGSVTIGILVAGGGAGGGNSGSAGNRSGGGGGSGAMFYNSSVSLPVGTYNVTIGSGGSGGSAGNGTSGNNTTFGSIVTSGYGGYGGAGTFSSTVGGNGGNSGGSGGGTTTKFYGGGGGGSGGGSGSLSGTRYGRYIGGGIGANRCGGGGAGCQGAGGYSPNMGAGGTGGTGITLSFPTSVNYCAGGGGGVKNSGGAGNGGNSSAGNGGTETSASTSAQINQGGGGGGGGSGSAGNGGRGVLVVRHI